MRVGVEVFAGNEKRRAQARGRIVTGVAHVQEPAAVPQFVREVVQGQFPVEFDVVRGELKRHREPVTQLRQQGHGLPLRGCPGADAVGEQFGTVLRAERGDRAVPGAVLLDQAGQCLPAGDEDQARRQRQQQRLDVRGLRDVVEHDHGSPPAEQLAQPRRPPQLARVPVDPAAECVQQIIDDLFGLTSAVGVIAVQVYVDRMVRQMAYLAVRPVDGQRGLPDARQAVEDDHPGTEPAARSLGEFVDRA